MKTDAVWVIEADAFASRDAALRAAVERAGHEVLAWSDDWWRDGRFPDLADRAVVFHGSLGNADRIRRELPWAPGAFCATREIACSAWYERAAPWLVHERWHLTTASDLVREPRLAAQAIGADTHVFVRPDSPLKPFSGRVCELDGLTLGALDHGFYYDDPDLPVVVAPVREVGREWRFVVVDDEVVAGSGYEATGRAAQGAADGRAWHFAGEVASGLEAPERVYVLDVAEVDGALHLMELNPFSGADLYDCAMAPIVAAVSRVALE